MSTNGKATEPCRCGLLHAYEHDCDYVGKTRFGLPTEIRQDEIERVLDYFDFALGFDMFEHNYDRKAVDDAFAWANSNARAIAAARDGGTPARFDWAAWLAMSNGEARA